MQLIGEMCQGSLRLSFLFFNPKKMDACLYSPDVSSSRITGLLSTHQLQWEATRTCHYS